MKHFMSSLVFIGLCACTHQSHSHHSSSAPIEKGEMGGANYAFRSGTYFMGQPTLATLDEAKKQGVTTVINLRTEEENKSVNYNAAAETKKRGLSYYSIPIDPRAPLSKETLAQIESAYMSHHKKGEKVIVHCASGQRVGAWFAYHIRTTHGESPEQALHEAEAVGLSSVPLIEQVKRTIQ
jgi:uncharacterized protein (TIGR01244 family)